MTKQNELDLIKKDIQFAFNNKLNVCIKTYDEEIFNPAKIEYVNSDLLFFGIFCSLEEFDISMFDVKTITWTGKGD